MTSAERVARYRAKRNEAKPKRSLPPVKAELLPGPLTVQIAKDSFVRRLIDASFPELARVSRVFNQRFKDAGYGPLPKVHGHGVVAMLAGTAIDYRIRLYFSRRAHDAPMVQRGAFFFDRLSKKGNQLGSLLATCDRFIARVKPNGRKLSNRSEEKLCRYAVVLAYLDCIGRAPGGNTAAEVLTSILRRDAGATLRRIDNALATDVVRLSRSFYEGHVDLVRKARRVVVGGTLAGSADVGGADFDLLVDGCLIDFKATREAKVTTRTLRQLVGYWLLDYDDKYKIRSFAVSLLRHGHTERLDLQRDLLPAGDIATLRAAFRRELLLTKQSQVHAGKPI